MAWGPYSNQQNSWGGSGTWSPTAPAISTPGAPAPAAPAPVSSPSGGSIPFPTVISGAGAIQGASGPAAVPPSQQTSATDSATAAIQAEVNALNQQAAAQKQQDQMNAMQAVNSAMPWLQQMGLTNQIKQWIIEGYTDPSALVALVRQTPQWQKMFPGIRRPDGTLRYDEATYLNHNDQYRAALRNYGPAGVNYSTPDSLAAFHTQGIDPTELTTRLQAYDTIQRSSSDVKASFYVYAGMNVTTDDLYRASVDPAFRQQLNTAYTQAVTLGNPDYQTFITRSTEWALNQIAAKSAQSGAALPTQNLHALNPKDAWALMDTLYHGGQPNGNNYLSLDQLQNAFENAMVGGALTSAGLVLPDAANVQKWRQAGVDQAAAYKAGAAIHADRNLWAGELQRSGRGSAMTDLGMEDALFGTDARQQLLLQQAQSGETALGQTEGGVASHLGNVPGQVEQTGFLGRY